MKINLIVIMDVTFVFYFHFETTKGPNFEYTYYISVVGVLGSIVNVFAICLYQKYLHGWSFRRVLIFMKVTCCLLSVIDLIIFKRWNIAIGIPDKIFFLLAAIRRLSFRMLSIPLSSISAKMAPPGMESTVFGKFVSLTSLTKKNSAM